MATRLTPPPREFLFEDEAPSDMDAGDNSVLAVDPIDPALIPEPLAYRVIIRPKPASEKYGSSGLVMAGRTKNTDLAVRTIGQVLKRGPLAWTAVMDSMDYKKDPIAHSIVEGDWVIYRQNSGQKIKIGRKAGAFPDDEGEDQFLLIMSDTDIFCKIAPEQASKYYDWVS